MKKRILLSILAASFIGVASCQPVKAASGSLYLASSVQAPSSGSQFTVSVRENSGSIPVNATQANLNFPSGSLEVVSISSSSAFPLEAQTYIDSSSVNLARGAFSPVTSDQL